MDLDWKRNLSNTDRVIRTVIGIILLALVLTNFITGVWAVIAVLFAISQFVEAYLAY